MKIDGLDKITINGKGQVTINIENIEDFWTLANTIRVGDKIGSQIHRKITRVSSTGKTDSHNIIILALSEKNSEKSLLFFF